MATVVTTDIPEEARATSRGRRGPAEQGDAAGLTRPMTYDEYLASPEEVGRYDIIDGWKACRRYGEKQLTNPTRQHQRILRRIARAMEDYASRTGSGEAISAPCDVLVVRRPLRIRQPDVLYISQERLARNPPPDDPGPLSPAPELVVEIMSPSDRPSILAAKVADYRAIDVREVWIVRSVDQTVEVLELSIDEIRSIATLGAGQAVISSTFPGLTVDVDSIFAA